MRTAGRDSAIYPLPTAQVAHEATLYLAGSGELSGLALEVARRYPGRLQLLGSVAPPHVSCLLRRGGAYISSAPNETYGRSLVEALRCSLPLLSMTTKCFPSPSPSPKPQPQP